MLKSIKEKVNVLVARVERHSEYRTTHHAYSDSSISIRGAMNDFSVGDQRTYSYLSKGNYFFGRLYILATHYSFTKQVYFYLERFNDYKTLEYSIINKDQKAEKIALGKHGYEDMLSFKYKRNLFKKAKPINKQRDGRIVAQNCIHIKNIPYF